MPGEYHAIAETKLIGGQHIDMMYSEEDRLIRWNTAGWTRSLDGLPGMEEIKAGMYPINVPHRWRSTVGPPTSSSPVSSAARP